MERTLNEDTPRHVYDAVADLMSARTRRGPYKFLDDLYGGLALIPERSEIAFDRARFHPIDDAIELARRFAVEVEAHADARSWKAASSALRTVEDCQRTYWVRRHVETLRPHPGFVIVGDVTQRVPRIHVYRAEGDVHLFRLPPTSSQEAVDAAIDAWIAGCRHGAERSVRLVRRTVAYIEDAIQ